MTTDAYGHEGSPPSLATGLNLVRHTLGYITKIFGYGIALAAYVVIFVVSIATLGLIEIRQANLKDSNALIAILEQQENYLNRGHLDQEVRDLAKNIDQYRGLDASSTCSDQEEMVLKGQPGSISTFVKTSNGDPAGPSAEPKSCAEAKAIANQHLNGLISLKYKLMFEKATLPKYYDEYTDGLREKTPQLIPLLRYMDSRSPMFLRAWARLPLELLEMLLLVCMGSLGGVIGVTRCFVDAEPNPAARDLCYRPVAGAVIALGIYVLFRATQLFFGGGGQDSATTVSTSVFLLAALGLASGFCAREAVAQIEFWARKLLRGGDAPGKRNASPADPLAEEGAAAQPAADGPAPA
jgi:hypothetical protein